MIDDKLAREVLQRKITQINSFPKSAIKEVSDLMSSKYNVKYGSTIDIFNGRNPIEFLDYDMLYKLMVCIKEISMNRWEQIDPSDLYLPKYFTELELKQYDFPISIDDSDKDIVIDKFLKISDDYWITVKNIEEIYEWRNLDKIKYNENTQKNLVIKESKGIYIRVLRIVTQAIKSITTLMRKNEFIPDDITINVNPEMFPDGIIEERDKLIISKDATIDLIDGMHQYISMCEVKDLNPNWNYSTEVRITFFNEEKANKYILQRNNKNHLTDEEKTEKNKSSEANFIINKLNESHNFYLKGTLKPHQYVINKILNQIYDIDNNNIETHIKIRQKSVELANTIEKNINKLIEISNLFDIEFTKEYWFISLFMLNYCEKKGLEYEDIMKKIDLEKLSGKIVFKKLPTINNIKTLREVIKDVL